MEFSRRLDISHLTNDANPWKPVWQPCCRMGCSNYGNFGDGRIADGLQVVNKRRTLARSNSLEKKAENQRPFRAHSQRHQSRTEPAGVCWGTLRPSWVRSSDERLEWGTPRRPRRPGTGRAGVGGHGLARGRVATGFRIPQVVHASPAKTRYCQQ